MVYSFPCIDNFRFTNTRQSGDLLCSSTLLQIALSAAVTAAQRVCKLGNAKQRRNQKRARDQNAPPAAAQDGLIGKREHTAPRDDLQRQSNAHKAERGLGQNGASDIHDHHK